MSDGTRANLAERGYSHRYLVDVLDVNALEAEMIKDAVHPETVLDVASPQLVDRFTVMGQGFFGSRAQSFSESIRRS